MDNTWSEWRPFPSPAKGEKMRVIAPVGPGCYELRRGDIFVLIGESKTVAQRMRSLLPNEHGGVGHRSNEDKRQYVFENLKEIEYRTIATPTKQDAVILERQLRQTGKYLFNT